MNSRKGYLVVGAAALFLSACGSSADDDDQCAPTVVDGSPFSSSGTATVHGSGVLPPGYPDGLQLELLLNSGTSSLGVLPPNLLDSPDTCGRSFSYTIHDVEAGTYKLDYDLFAHDSSGNAKYTGTSTNEFTVTDGADIAFDPTF